MKVALIPARGGSKRIVRKNVRSFCGRPMITWPIVSALESGCFDHVVVSTDDQEIAEIAREAGASTPFVRPAELAGDEVGTRTVIQHALEQFDGMGWKVDVLACVYATAAFLRSGDLREATDLFGSVEADFVVSVVPYTHPIERALRIGGDGRIQMADRHALGTRTQDLPQAFHDAAQFYVVSPRAFLSGTPALSAAAQAFVLPAYRVQDIDTEEDWIRAEVAFRVLQELGR